MTSSHGRRIQGRRALAIMAWVSLVVVAWLLWRGQHSRLIRVQAWEPAALLLSAYATFLAIFGWLLFSPGRIPWVVLCWHAHTATAMLHRLPPDACWFAIEAMADNRRIRVWHHRDHESVAG